MHAILSYHGNRPTHTQTHTIQTGPITVHCAAKLSVQCNNALWPPHPGKCRRASTSKDHGQAPSYLTLLLQSHIYQAVSTYIRRKTETTTVHVYSLDSVGVHSRCLDLMPGTVPRQLRGIAVASTFKRHLKSELFFQAYGISTTASTFAEP